MVADTAEDVLETLTACFASGAGGVPELGLAGADTNVVLVAWKRHLALYTNAARFRRWSHGIAYTLYSLSLLTTTVSVLYSLFGAWGDPTDSCISLLEHEMALAPPRCCIDTFDCYCFYSLVRSTRSLFSLLLDVRSKRGQGVGRL